MKILLLDDSASIRRIIRQTLEPQGDFEFLEAYDGKDGLALLETHGEVALIITDDNMPVVGGLELTRRLRASHPEIPILLTSAEAEGESITRAVRAGVNDYLAKPFTPERLLAKVRKLAPSAFPDEAPASE